MWCEARQNMCQNVFVEVSDHPTENRKTVSGGKRTDNVLFFSFFLFDLSLIIILFLSESRKTRDTTTIYTAVVYTACCIT